MIPGCVCDLHVCNELGFRACHAVLVIADCLAGRLAAGMHTRSVLRVTIPYAVSLTCAMCSCCACRYRTSGFSQKNPHKYLKHDAADVEAKLRRLFFAT